MRSLRDRLRWSEDKGVVVPVRFGAADGSFVLT